MRQHLAVEEHVVTDGAGRLDQLGERAGRLLQVAREELDPIGLAVELAAHAVVLLLRPHGVRAHAREGFVGRLDRAREHEPDGLKQRDRARLEAVLDVLQRDRPGLCAPGQRLAGPVAEVGMLAKDAAQLVLVLARHRRHDLAQSRPAEAKRAPLRWREGAPAHVDGGAAQVLLAQRPEVSAEDAGLLEGGRCAAHGGPGPCEIKHRTTYRRSRCEGALTSRNWSRTPAVLCASTGSTATSITARSANTR